MPAAEGLRARALEVWLVLGDDRRVPSRKPREQGDVGVVAEKKPKTEKPRLWKVLLHNDDFTTQDFVEAVLMAIFNKTPAEAHELMLRVHTRGFCVAGVYTHEVAETKVAAVERMAQAAEFPFLSTMEPA
jgi:ATP-dependent Clp protease adaptor protein ClpS